jgi:hypothetical protein
LSATHQVIRVIQIFNPTFVNFGLFLVAGFTTPIQGLPNFLIYFGPLFAEETRKYREQLRAEQPPYSMASRVEQLSSALYHGVKEAMLRSGESVDLNDSSLDNDKDDMVMREEEEDDDESIVEDLSFHFSSLVENDPATETATEEIHSVSEDNNEQQEEPREWAVSKSGDSFVENGPADDEAVGEKMAGDDRDEGKAHQHDKDRNND